MTNPVHPNIAALEEIADTVEQALEEAAPFLAAIERYAKAADALAEAEGGLEGLGMRSLFTGRPAFVFEIDDNLSPHFKCWACGEPLTDGGLILIETDADYRYTGRVIAVHQGRCDQAASGPHIHPWRHAQTFIGELAESTGVTPADLRELADGLEAEGGI